MIKHSFVHGTLQIVLSRAPVNAFDEAMVGALDAVLSELESRPEIAVVHFRSDQKAFCAGADLKLMAACFSEADGVRKLLAHVKRMQRVFDRIEHLPQVTVAEIGGFALGGGLELALSCDLRIGAASARIGLPEARLGLLPGAGGTQRLSRLCGPGVARQLILTGDVIDCQRGKELGIFQWAVPDERLRGEADRIVCQVLELSPAALAASKKCLAAVDELPSSGFELEVLETGALLGSSDTRGRIAAFLER